MRVTRLSWAGLNVSAGDTTVVVDLLEDAGPGAPFMGAPREALLALDGDPVDAALLTHLHPDHMDVAAIQRRTAPDAPVFLHPLPPVLPQHQAEKVIGRRLIPTVPYDAHEVGEFTLTAVPASDGLGDPQVSWVLETGDARIIHCGDTIWHGHWWEIAQRLGPFDAAFLPINGALVDYPHRQPASGEPAVLTPEQAARAARILGARTLVPIHFGAFHFPPVYTEWPDCLQALHAAAAVEQVHVTVLEPGESLDLLAQATELAPSAAPHK